MTDKPFVLPDLLIEPLIRTALLEDLGRAGDITTDALTPTTLTTQATIVARESGTVAGLRAAELSFRLIDPTLFCEALVADGARVVRGDRVLQLSGSARALLTAERTALNFLCRLSGIATATAALVDAVRDYPVGVTCTRKTTPGLRALEKAAVRAGGGVNHRFGLDDAVLIKDNHIALVGGVAAAVRRARDSVGHLVKIEVEVDTLEQLDEALGVSPDAILLDNMTPEELRRAVDKVAGRAKTEASGRITVETAPAIAAAGVDLMSAGWLTHSARSLDLALDIADT
ncbi:MAG: carboxylating nicotinate-nucleotide diphosphorylase [Candidatus Competibacterales bacterium]|nr:carboxylating nicotinate-nucleotide diphosphorylase [Candidatus Competibacterales bacterium]